MNRITRTVATITAAIATGVTATCASVAVQAAEPTPCAAPHPAMARAGACAAAGGIDANTFIVMPPATTRWLVSTDAAGTTTTAAVPHVRRNFDHPAVAVARMQRTAGVDASTFIVQPPVTVSWTVMPQDTVFAAVPGRAVAR